VARLPWTIRISRALFLDKRETGHKAPLTVRLSGGLGNQLFQYAAARAAALLAQCELLLDVSELESAQMNVTPRPFELTPLMTVGVITRWSHQSRLAVRAACHRSSVIPVIAHKLFRIFCERGFEYDSRVRNVRPGDTLVGYFQSPHYFASCAQQLDADLHLKQPSHWYQSLTEEITGSPGSVAVHMRRGDYLVPTNARTHGVLTDHYYQRSLELLSGDQAVGGIYIFTDSKDPSIIQNMNWPGHVTLVQPPPTSNPAESLLAMSHASAVVTANSSFSWWAAWLAWFRTNATVLVPDPWFRDERFSSDDLVPDAWTRVQADWLA